MTHEPPPAETARRLMRAQDTATLATAHHDGGWPFASLVLVAADHDATPLLLISTLAEHTKNLAAEPRVSLLFDGTAGLESRLTGPRVTVLGKAEISQASHHRERFLARHPDAAVYADFGDFAVYRIAVERAHLVAGFGKIDWILVNDLLSPLPESFPLKEQESGVVTHMNEDHADAIQLYATRLLGAEGEGWRMTGCDPEGCDLRQGGEVLRLDFDKPVHDAESARVELVRLVKRARGFGDGN